MNEKILILEASRYSLAAMRVYRDIGSVKTCSGDPMEIRNNDQITVLVCRLGYHLNAKFLAMFPNLKFIVSPTTGLNHIDQGYCETHGILIVSLKGETKFLDSIRSTSEHTISLILALVRNVVPGVKSVVEHHQWDRDLFMGREMSALTLGVLGVGRIGQHIISYAKAFGMSVLACDPYKDMDNLKEHHVKVCSKEELFAQADIVTLHVDYRPENREMISRKEFVHMKPGSYFINTSRGELVSENDIVWALEKGILAGAALDVLSDEQDIEGLFNKKILQYARQNDHLIITPHIGGCTSDAMRNTELFVAGKLLSLIQRER